MTTLRQPRPRRGLTIPTVIASSVVALVLAIGIAPVSAPAQGTPAQEYQLKAVFLYHFAQFVEWPDTAFAAVDAPLTICVLGKDPFGAYLDDAVRGERVETHPLEIRRYQDVEQIPGCHIVFVGSDADRLAHVLGHLSNRPALVVGDSDNFARRGGMVGFVKDRNRIRLHVNLAVAEAAGLKLSSKLLRPAEIVSTRTR